MPTDIRGLDEHEQTLEESESRSRTMFEAGQDAIVITDDAAVCIRHPPAVAAMFGLPPERLLGRKVSHFLDDTLDFPPFWRDFLATGSFHGELGLIDARGERHEVDCYGVTNILPGQHMVVIRDITERKQAQRALEAMNERLQMQAEELEEQTEELRVQTEELRVQTDEVEAANAALRQSEERLRLAQQAGRVGVFDRDLQNNTAFWTPELEELFGIPAGTFEGKPEDWATRISRGPSPNEIVPAGVDAVRAHGRDVGVPLYPRGRPGPLDGGPRPDLPRSAHKPLPDRHERGHHRCASAPRDCRKHTRG
jgi:PAS domain-containing protein